MKGRRLADDLGLVVLIVVLAAIPIAVLVLGTAPR